MNKIYYIILLLFGQFLLAQQKINGRIESDGTVENIFIANITNKTNTSTNANGEFTIEANSGDQLIITVSFIEPLKVVLNQNSFKQTTLVIYVKAKVRYLEEVNVKAISAKSLGVVGNVKTYTPVERKIKTAGNFKWYSPLLIPFGGMSVDGLLNTINGKVKRLRKELAIEKKEMLIQKLDNMLPDSFYEEELQIQNQYIRGFKIYCIEVEDLTNAINANNTIMASFLLAELAVEYKTQILKE